MKYLLDAPVVVAAIKGRLPVVLRLSKLKPGDVAVSIVSRLETESSLRALARPPPRFGKLLREFFASVKVLDFGAAEAQQAANVAAYLRGAEAMTALDLMVASTALAHRLLLVTDRPAVFSGVPNLDLEQWK